MTQAQATAPAQTQWIKPFTPDFHVSSTLWNKKASDNILYAVAQRTAYVAAAAIVGLLEAVKYVACKAMNVGIWTLNKAHSYFNPKQEEEKNPAPIEPAVVVNQPAVNPNMQQVNVAVINPAPVVNDPAPIVNDPAPVVTGVAPAVIHPTPLAVKRVSSCEKATALLNRAWEGTKHYANTGWANTKHYAHTGWTETRTFAERQWAKLPAIRSQA